MKSNIVNHYVNRKKIPSIDIKTRRYRKTITDILLFTMYGVLPKTKQICSSDVIKYDGIFLLLGDFYTQ